MTNRFAALALAGALAISAAACGRTAELDANGMPAPLAAPSIAITNSNWSDVNVFAVTDGQSHRLGMVTTNQTARFEVPNTLRTGGSFNLVVEPIGSSDRHVTPAVMISPGQEVVLNVANTLALSTLVVQ